MGGNLKFTANFKGVLFNISFFSPVKNALLGNSGIRDAGKKNS